MDELEEGEYIEDEEEKLRNMMAETISTTTSTSTIHQERSKTKSIGNQSWEMRMSMSRIQSNHSILVTPGKGNRQGDEDDEEQLRQKLLASMHSQSQRKKMPVSRIDRSLTNNNNKRSGRTSNSTLDNSNETPTTSAAAGNGNEQLLEYTMKFELLQKQHASLTQRKRNLQQSTAQMLQSITKKQQSLVQCDVDLERKQEEINKMVPILLAISNNNQIKQQEQRLMKRKMTNETTPNNENWREEERQQRPLKHRSSYGQETSAQQTSFNNVRKIINEISTPSPKRRRSDKPDENLTQSTAITSTPLSVSSLTARANQPSTSTDKKQKVRKVKKWKPHHKHKTKRAGIKHTNMGKDSRAAETPSQAASSKTKSSEKVPRESSQKASASNAVKQKETVVNESRITHREEEAIVEQQEAVQAEIVQAENEQQDGVLPPPPRPPSLLPKAALATTQAADPQMLSTQTEVQAVQQEAPIQSEPANVEQQPPFETSTPIEQVQFQFDTHPFNQTLVLVDETQGSDELQEQLEEEEDHQSLEEGEIVSSIFEDSEQAKEEETFDLGKIDPFLMSIRSYRLSPSFPARLIGHPAISNRLNPFIPLCPFQLNGRCADSQCIYQHEDEYTLSEPEIVEEIIGYYPKLCPRGMTPSEYASHLLANGPLDQVAGFLISKMPDEVRQLRRIDPAASQKRLASYFRPEKPVPPPDEPIEYHSITNKVLTPRNTLLLV